MLPLLAFGLSNLWLASPWGRAWIASKITCRLGLKTHLGAASWSPWHGLTLRDIEVAQPPEVGSAIADPLVSISALRLHPVWRSCLRGRLAVSTVELDSPRLVVTVEMLSHLARQAPVPAAPASTPPIAAHPPPADTLPQIALTSPETPGEAAPGTAPPGDHGATGSPPPPAAPPKPPPVAPPKPPLPPTRWIHLRHASLRLVSADGARPLVEIDDLGSALPVFGDVARSTLHMACLKANGKTLLSGFQASLTWQSPVLSLSPVETSIDGIKLAFAGKLALLEGLPLQLEAQMPKQAPTPLALPGGGVATAAHASCFGRFRGLLLAPGTWQGECLAEAGAISIQQGEHQTAFDRASCTTVLRGNLLSCVDARCISDDLSLLGNATLLADGRAAGVIRVIAPPETAIGLVKRFFPHSDPGPNLTPLSTPQRVAFDLEAFGTFKDLKFRLGQNGPLVPSPQ